MFGRIAGYTFLSSLLVFLLLRGYWSWAWNSSAPSWLLGLSIVALIGWLVFSIKGLILWLKQRKTQFAISLVVLGIAALLIVGTLNWFAAINNKKWDLSQNKIYSLSDQTQKVLEGLKEKIVIRVWSSSLDKMSQNVDLKQFFENYEIAAKGKVSVEFKNPNQDLILARQDKITRDGVVMVKSAAGRESRLDNFNDAKAEEQITNAILNAVKGSRKKQVCFLTGHGEPALNNSEAPGLAKMKDLLATSSYDSREIALITLEKVPAECEALAIVGPQSPTAEREMKMIHDYLNSGGKVLALLGLGAPPSWKKIGAAYGVDVKNDLLLDPRYQPPIVVVTRNFAQDVEIVRGLNRVVMLPESSSLSVATQSPDPKATVRTFVSSESYAYTKNGDIKQLRTLGRSTMDPQGAMPMAALITKPVDEEAPAKPSDPKAAQEEKPKKQMALVLIGNSSFVRNSFIEEMSNRDLLLNSVNYLLEDKDMMGIRPRELRRTSLELSPERLRMAETTFLILILMFVMGSVMASRRKAT